MRLTPDQKNRLLNLLAKIAQQEHKCALCEATEWRAADAVFELREFHRGHVVGDLGDAVFPVIPITCANCGNTHLVNPLVEGILQAKDIEEAGVRHE